MTGRRILIAPDSFKRSIRAADAAHAIAQGWQLVHPADQVFLRPMADGGEGTSQVVHAAVPNSRWQPNDTVRTRSEGPGISRWLQLPGRAALIELAESCGIELYSKLDAMSATTYPLGETIRAAIDAGAQSLVIALGGSAATDGGTGALRALGARFLDAQGRELPKGGGALRNLAQIDLSELIAPPAGGVRVLVDVTAPLTGPQGAAVQFSQQKGANASQVELLDAGLGHLSQLVAHTIRATSIPPMYHTVCDLDTLPGAGAAGGTGFGLAALWGAQLVPGARHIADIIALSDIATHCDVVITGEGQLDDTSGQGKVIHEVLERSGHTARKIVVCGRDRRTDKSTRFPLDTGHDFEVIELAELSGSVVDALEHPHMWLRQAGQIAAQHL